MVHIDEVTELMEQMMKVDIFSSSEKLRMLKDQEKTFLDPNLIMDTRHRILREDLSISPTKSSVLAEARRLLTQEEARDLYIKKQQRFLERELKKFETEIRKSRPKFLKAYTCKKSNIAPSDDEDFWGTSRRIKSETIFHGRTEKSDNGYGRNMEILRKSTVAEIEDLSLKIEDEKEPINPECKVPCIGNIKVTIKDKLNFESESQRLSILRKCFDALKQYAKEERRFRDIKTKIQQNVASRITKKYFNIWRTYMINLRSDQKEQKKEEISEERKIEMFINAIMERQRELMKSRQANNRDINLVVKESNTTEMKRKNLYSKPIVVESPSQCRLNAQKQIIEKQRAKLMEQNKIIEEFKLKQAQEEISRASKETLDIAKETFTHCGQKTRRTLIHLMQQAGYRKSLAEPQRVPDPPKFLIRMEARAEARRKRIKLAEESRKRKLEEQKRKEEISRIEEEQTKRRLQQETLVEARRLRKQQEQNRLRELQKLKKLNDIADVFYRKYLLRHYLMGPLIALVEQKRSSIKKANDHYRKSLIRKVFMAWKNETEIQYKIKIEIVESFYNRKLMVSIFEEWKLMAKELNLKVQVATDFYDMKVLDKYFKLWQLTTLEQKVQHEKEIELVNNHYESKLKMRYFCMWKKYLTIAADIKESEKKKDELRQLVQKVIPDFNPIQRGVALED